MNKMTNNKLNLNYDLSLLPHDSIIIPPHLIHQTLPIAIPKPIFRLLLQQPKLRSVKHPLKLPITKRNDILIKIRSRKIDPQAFVRQHLVYQSQMHENVIHMIVLKNCYDAVPVRLVRPVQRSKRTESQWIIIRMVVDDGWNVETSVWIVICPIITEIVKIGIDTVCLDTSIQKILTAKIQLSICLMPLELHRLSISLSNLMQDSPHTKPDNQDPPLFLSPSIIEMPIQAAHNLAAVVQFGITAPLPHQMIEHIGNSIMMTAATVIVSQIFTSLLASPPVSKNGLYHQ